MTRQEAMTGVKPDISHYVPFNLNWICSCTQGREKTNLTHRAREIKMIGYADDLNEQTFPKQTYSPSI